MVDLIKAFGRGILYVFAFPFFVLALALFGAYGLLAFIFQIFKSIIYFFTGQKFFPELPEDKQLRLMHEAANPTTAVEQEQEKVVEEPESIPQEQQLVFEERYDEDDFLEEPSPETQQVQEKTVEEACFQEEIKPEPVPPVEESKPEVEESALTDLLNPTEEEDEEEVLETYRPKGSDESFDYEDDEEDTTNNGVNIKFDD